MYLPYAGIGSRNTPQEILDVMSNIGNALYKEGFTLRSGGADGADSAFERFILSHKKEIFIPWNGFNRRYRNTDGIYCGWPDPETEMLAYNMAAEHHPNWAVCSDGTKKLHMRNCAQIFGYHMNKPSKFVVCWTPDGKGGGGTGQAIRIAKAYSIPVFDLGADFQQRLDNLAYFCETLLKENQ